MTAEALSERLFRQQQAFRLEGLPSAAVRRNRIDRLVSMLFENSDALAEAMAADYGSRSPIASVMTEIMGIGSTIECTRKNLKRWMRPTRALAEYRLFGVKAQVEPTPKGVVGIIGPWNFPVNLVVGRMVQRAASDHLVPVTLELGGKDPVVVAQDADVAGHAGRIARARLINGGQVRLCPDYVFVAADRVEEFCQAASAAIREMRPSIVDSPDFCSSVNAANYERVLVLVEDAREKGPNVISVAPPGESLPDSATRKIAPTLVTNVHSGMRITSVEIFGPVLVVMGYHHLDDVIDYVNERPSPLAAYWYGNDSNHFRQFVRRTRSGGVSRNDFALHMSFPQTPFGGVGRSGMGAYHG